MKRVQPLTAALFVGFVATVIGANWAISHYGVVSVGFGLVAPAGVYFAGVAFGLRDALHERAGRVPVLAAIACGALLSYLVEGATHVPGGVTSIALASAVAFGLSELADFAVYEPLRERSWPSAVVASNVLGAVVDSALFLWLAFGSLEFLAGQVVGKVLMVALALPIVWYARRPTPLAAMKGPR